jgi:hypothetical protein
MTTKTIVLTPKNFATKREMYNRRRELKAQGWTVTDPDLNNTVLTRDVPEQAVARPSRRVSRRR